ncbi:acetyl-CoA carboxylase biotin carboxyl carrier protein [Phytoactinopolyspora limicola]|uniref:acetyl-CoA carboxylase biotin carboxyl carrier protein n=1 Tax=Phytoactinopolyspora limicola TaxID=2715536 RepID=UPI001A9C8952|nr:biotin/lipoyl-containing protein [Phytoactinopolyspora limicola]
MRKRHDESASAGSGSASGADADTGVDRIVTAVRQATLDLLAALTERPDRLSVRTDHVAIELDWRTVPAHASAVPTGVGPARVEAEPEGSDELAVGPASHYVRAPTVGTFYRAPEPGSPPFVSPGDTVTVGQQVGIIEVMKLMVPVEADRAGQVAEVLVADGSGVEHNQRLIVLAP